MNNSWTAVNRSRLSVLASVALSVACAIGSVGCYQGWNRPDRPGSGGGGPGALSERPIGLAIVDVFKPTADALEDPSCGATPGSLAPMRRSEIEARQRTIVEAVTPFADETRVIETTIDRAGCAGFGAIERRAISALDYPSLAEKVRAKPALHVRVVLWPARDRAGYPSPQVVGSAWADVAALRAQRIQRVISVTHFVLAQSGLGYFGYWRGSTLPSARHDAQTVADPAPTAEGQARVGDAIDASARSFRAFLDERLRTP